MKIIEFEGKQHQFPDDVTDDEINQVLGGPPKAPPSGQELIAKGIVSSGFGTQPYGSAEELERAEKSPLTPAALGGMAGTLAAAPLGRVPYLGPLARITGGAIGGEIGGRMGGTPPTTGALVGGGGAAFGEVIGAGAPKLGQWMMGGKGRIAAQDAARVGATAGELSPGLGSMTTVQDIRRAAVEAPKRLGAAKEVNVQAIEGAMGTGPGSRIISPDGQRMTLRQANEELSRIGDMMRGITPIDPRYRDVNLKERYGAMAMQIRQGIEDTAGPEMAALWDTTQEQYRAGRALIKPFQTGRAYRPGGGTEDIQLNTPTLQRWILDPKNEATLRTKLGDEGFMALADALTREGGVGGVDILAPGRGRTLDALLQLLRGTNTGAMNTIVTPARTLLPGAGSQFAGRQPYSLPPQLRAILDVILQKGVAGMAEPERRP